MTKRTSNHLLGGLSLLLVVILCSCSQNKTSSSTGALIDVTNPDCPSVFDFVDSLSLIQLEESDAALLSEETVKQFVVADEKYYVLDRKNKHVRVFLSSGDLLTVVDKVGRGAGEYPMADALLVDPGNNTLQILDPRGTVYQYNLSDFSTKTPMFLEDGSRAVHHFIRTPLGAYLFFSATTTPLLSYYNPSTGQTASWLDEIPSWFSRSFYYDFQESPFYLRNGTVYFYTGYNGAVYMFDEENLELKPYFSWDFKEQTFSWTDLSASDADVRLPSWKDKFDQISMHSILRVSRVCEGERFILAGATYRKEPVSLVYDKKNDRSYCFSKTSEGLLFRPKFAVDNVCYTLLNSETVPLFISPHILSDESSKKIFSSLSNDSNCVIVRYELKK